MVTVDILGSATEAEAVILPISAGSSRDTQRCEAEVFLDHLNSVSASPEPGQRPSLTLSKVAASTYLRDRIRAIRYENRRIREALRIGHEENCHLREELHLQLREVESLRKQLIQAENALRHLEADCKAANDSLTDIAASWNWRIAHGFHQFWRGSMDCLTVGSKRVACLFRNPMR
jgi:hypothetical protein